jgi:3-deoxy-D-manno-octulosonic-acid transferase
VKLLYNIGIQLYVFLIFVASFFNQKAKLWTTGRKNINIQLKNKFIRTDKIIWMHCASLGEFEQGRPVFESLKKKFHHHKFLLTFFSPSGYEVRKNYDLADFVCYLPADSPENVKAFLGILNIQMAIFVKYEFWRNFFHSLNQRKIPLFVISAIFRKDQIYFKWYGGFYKDILRNVNYFFVQDENSKELLGSIEINNVSVSGDTRFDRVFHTASQEKKFTLIEDFCAGHPVFIAGSTWQEDEILIAGIFKSTINYKLIIAPHEIDHSHIEKIEKLFNKKNIIKFSQIEIESNENKNVLLIDTIGHLSKIYSYGKVAYIGGGFGKGIHNILEAAAFGLPVIFGPNYKKFKEAKDLINSGGAFSVNSGEELFSVLKKLADDYNQYQKSAEICRSYVLKNKGATAIILTHLKNIFD